MIDNASGEKSVPRIGIALPFQVAAYLETNTNRLARLRSEGRGPVFTRIGRSIRYRWEDVHAFVEGNLQAASGEAATNPDSNDDDGGEVK
jgi:hypothetical protein